MSCKNCGKEIDEFEIFCDDCKKELKKASSREDVKVLEKLIEEHKEFNELEKTKELSDLKDFVSDNYEMPLDDNEVTKVIKIGPEDIEDKKIETREEKNSEIINKDSKKNKKKLIIIISSVVIVLIILIVTILLLNKGGDKEPEKDVQIDYEKIISDYGKASEKAVEEYLKNNTEVPTWQQISDLINYKEYEVVCEVHNIYSDGKVYLNSCKVNDKKVKHSYGVEQQEIKEGKKIEIYKQNYEDNYYSFTDKSSSGASLVGTVTCKTDTCRFIKGYNKYALIEEEKAYYLYNYENNSLEFGPFNMYDDDSYLSHIISSEDIVYGVFYREDNINNIYNVNTGKTLKNIKGELVIEELNFTPNLMYKYNYVILKSNGKYDFINLNTGNVSYSIKENISNFYEDTKNNIVYITAYTNNSNNFKIYNSNGKLLFDGKEFSRLRIIDGNLMVANNKNFYIYDNKLKQKVSSKTYDEVLEIYEDFIVVIDNKHLEILDLNDKILATFEDEWDSNKYIFNSVGSGWSKENGKDLIYLLVEDKTIPYGTLGSGLKYYYIPSTKEVGVTKTTGIN